MLIRVKGVASVGVTPFVLYKSLSVLLRFFDDEVGDLYLTKNM